MAKMGFDDAYRAPIEDDEEAPRGVGENDQFYVVAPSKLTILFLSTLGIYAVYWFYKHWDSQRQTHRTDTWPVLRGIFAIFFTHSLFRTIDQAARLAGYSPNWEPSGQATIYVVLVIGTRVVSRMEAFADTGGMLGLISTGLALTSLVPLLAAQKVANLVSGDPDGRRNAAISPANLLFIVVGALLWGLVIMGLFFSGSPEP